MSLPSPRSQPEIAGYHTLLVQSVQVQQTHALITEADQITQTDDNICINHFTYNDGFEAFKISSNTGKPVEHAYTAWHQLTEVTRGSFTEQGIGADQYRALQCLFFLEEQGKLKFSQLALIHLWHDFKVSVYIRKNPDVKEFHFSGPVPHRYTHFSIDAARSLVENANTSHEPHSWVLSALLCPPSLLTGVMWMLTAAGMGGVVFAWTNPFMFAAVALTVIMLSSLAAGFCIIKTSDKKEKIANKKLIEFAASQSLIVCGSGAVTGIFLLALSLGTATFSLTNPVMWATVGLAVLCILCYKAARGAPKIADFFSQKRGHGLADQSSAFSYQNK